MNEFEYKGLKFKPLKRLKGKEDDFHEISKRISNIGITPEGWNYKEFYSIAIEADKKNKNIDLFEANGITVIPAERVLFKYE